MKFILITGDLEDGFDTWGPFPDRDAAHHYAEIHHDEWQVMKLNKPEERP